MIKSPELSSELTHTEQVTIGNAVGIGERAFSFDSITQKRYPKIQLISCGALIMAGLNCKTDMIRIFWKL
jgi:hypothetical protein